MAKIQVTHISGKIMEGASWDVDTVGRLSQGETVRLSLPVRESKLARYLQKNPAQECILEDEDDGKSVTVGLLVEKFTHMLDTEGPRLESMAWLKPMNRTVEAVMAFILDRESCDSRFLTAVGVKKREGDTEEAEAEPS